MKATFLYCLLHKTICADFLVNVPAGEEGCVTEFIEYSFWSSRSHHLAPDGISYEYYTWLWFKLLLQSNVSIDCTIPLK